MLYIDKVDVDGTKYEIVGPGGEYPSSVIVDTDGDGGQLCESSVEVSWYWRRVNAPIAADGYDYALVAVPSEGPEDVYYSTGPS